MAHSRQFILLIALIITTYCTLVSTLKNPPRYGKIPRASRPPLQRRQLPAQPTNVTTISSPNGVKIRYKEPGKEGICETTPGVNSYSGYVDLDNQTHMFFWFFEARSNPSKAPITLWLNGGPGADSLIGLFQELGPCSVTEDLKLKLNPYSWNEYSNLLFLSQPIGVGFSYQTEIEGIFDPATFEPVASSKPDGRFADVDEFRFDTTATAAAGTWEILQAFFANLPQLDPNIKSRTFNLWTESYGGHFGPGFFDYFEGENKKIANGTSQGVQLQLDTLGIGNGIIDSLTQFSYYPEFAVHNTYGIKAYNDTIYNFAKMAYYFPNGCRDSIVYCSEYDITTRDGQVACAQATQMCRTFVEYPYYDYSGRGPYDIRISDSLTQPPDYFEQYLNQAKVQNALGVNLNYTYDSSEIIFNGFTDTGDWVYPTILQDLERLLNSSVRVALYYGDADYICNWFGGEAVANEVNYTHSQEFRKAGYTPFVVDGVEYGEVKQYGNFSFLRIYEAGHEVPYYQPKAALAMFERVLKNQAVADGSKLTPGYSTNGTTHATHTESFVPLPTGGSESASSLAASSTASSIPIIS